MLFLNLSRLIVSNASHENVSELVVRSNLLKFYFQHVSVDKTQSMIKVKNSSTADCKILVSF